MVRDYLKEKRSVRHCTPDLSSHRVCYNNQKGAQVKNEEDVLLLDEDEE